MNNENMLNKYKDLLRQSDLLEREKKDNEYILDELDSMWYKLSSKEQKEVAEFSIHLHEQWTLEELHMEACEVITSIKSMIPAHSNDHTPTEVRLKQLTYWENKRDQISQKMIDFSCD